MCLSCSTDKLWGGFEHTDGKAINGHTEKESRNDKDIVKTNWCFAKVPGHHAQTNEEDLKTQYCSRYPGGKSAGVRGAVEFDAIVGRRIR